MSQEKLNEWLKKYQHDYVAHAIWDKIKEIFESGELMAAEEILRKTKRVSYEKGQKHGKRGESTITKELEEAVKNTPLPQLVRIVENHPLEDFHGNVVHIYPLWYEKQTVFNNEQLVEEHTKKISEIIAKTGASITEIQVAADMYSQDSIDNRLSRVWQANAEKNERNNYLREQLADARHHEIDPTPLCFEIRMLYCEIYWAYGDVVVLRGDASDKIHLREKNPGSFAYTIEPYENGGKFPKIELSDERTIILGPEKILAEFRQNPKYASFNVIYIEELSLEQLEIFHVPDKLRPESKKKLVESNTIQPVSTLADKNHGKDEEDEIVISFPSDLNDEAIPAIQQQIKLNNFEEALILAYDTSGKSNNSIKILQYTFNVCISKLVSSGQYKEAFKFLQLADKSPIEVDKNLKIKLYTSYVKKLTAEVKTSPSSGETAIQVAKAAQKNQIQGANALLNLTYDVVVKTFWANDQYEKALLNTKSAKEDGVDNASELETNSYINQLNHLLNSAQKSLDNPNPLTGILETLKLCEKSNNILSQLATNSELPRAKGIMLGHNLILSPFLISKLNSCIEKEKAIPAVKMIMRFLKNDPLSQENIELLKIEAKQLLADAKYANRISDWEQEIDDAQGIKSLDESIQTIISSVNKMPSMLYYLSSKMGVGDSELISKLRTFREKTLASLVSQQANTHSTNKTLTISEVD